MEAEKIILKEYQQESSFDPQTEFMKVWLKYSSVGTLIDEINHHVYGQEEAVKKASLIIYHYLKNLAIKGRTERLNFMMIGESGCGKTTFARAVKKVLSPLPVILANASSISQSGFSGPNASDILDNSGEFRKFNSGIVFLDEIDKLFTPKFDAKGANVSLSAINDFLKMLDGDSILTRDGSECLDCSRTIFIGLAAFSDIRGHEEDVSHIGFGSRSEHIDKKIVDRDAITSYCQSEQIMGRFLSIISLKKPSYDVYHKVALDAVYEIAKVYGRSETRQVMDNIDKIVHDSIESEYGCRNIRNAVWEYFLTHNDICA